MSVIRISKERICDMLGGRGLYDPNNHRLKVAAKTMFYVNVIVSPKKALTDMENRYFQVKTCGLVPTLTEITDLDFIAENF